MAILLELSAQNLDDVDRICNAPPSHMLERRITFSVEPEVCIVLALYQPVSSLLSIAPPRLHRQRLVEIVLVSVLLVRFFDYGLDLVGGIQGPKDECTK